ncbi:GFA family protein [Devosia sp.]|uniref:GFA family protein n=1 Tax=Devosia sp. TaxID=1871048 RepID=UPI001B1DEF6B|nr:GFA family protein [Devosia sp.]MBO9588177.1 GFA family protein [Devosia sp.]
MRVDGSCHCGAIRFEAEIDPEKVRLCHCTDCQQLSGTAFRVVAPCPEQRFHLLQGTPRIYVKTAESGRHRQQAFCADCGSALYATSDEPAGERSLGLRVGVLGQRRELVPKRQFWVRSALPWLPALPGDEVGDNG